MAADGCFETSLGLEVIISEGPEGWQGVRILEVITGRDGKRVAQRGCDRTRHLETHSTADINPPNAWHNAVSPSGQGEMQQPNPFLAGSGLKGPDEMGVC